MTRSHLVGEDVQIHKLQSPTSLMKQKSMFFDLQIWNFEKWIFMKGLFMTLKKLFEWVYWGRKFEDKIDMRTK